MNNQDRNGRNVALPDENQPSWRPNDRPGDRVGDDRHDRDWDASWDDGQGRSTERYGQGQSGYAAGRYEGDRSYGSRNQSGGNEWPRDRGTDERFSGGRGGESWSPMDRSDRGMQGSRGEYGHPGSGPRGWEDDDRPGMRGGSYGDGSSMNDGGDRQQSSREGGRGVKSQGGLYGQGGYNEGMYGRGGHQDRYGSQGYQGWGPSGQQTTGSHMSDQRWGQQGNGGMYGGSGGHGQQGESMNDQSFGQRGVQPGTSGMGYGQQPEHAMPFRGGQGSMQGPHRGKGPKGYARSDERVREMVCDCLTDDHHIDASHIEVVVKSGEVTLSGTVEDRQQKRRAEDIIERLSGVTDVVNNLRVGNARSLQGSSAMSSSGSPATSGNDASAVNASGREQAQQGNNGADKRHRA